jgi:opacity protein-like surface antigen
MKRSWVIYIITLIVLFSFSLADAKDMAGKFGVGANWFFYLENEAEWDDDDYMNEATAADANVHVSYHLPQPTDVVNLNLVLDWEWISRDITLDEDVPFSDDFATLTMMPLMLTLQLRVANLGVVVPYLGIGAGYSFNSISEGDLADDFEDVGADVDLDVEGSFALKVPVGADIFITDFLAVNLEAKYFYTQPEVEGTIEYLGREMTEEEELDQSTFAFGVGLSFYF